MNPNQQTEASRKIHCLKTAERMTMWQMVYAPALPMLSMDASGNLGPPAPTK